MFNSPEIFSLKIISSQAGGIQKTSISIHSVAENRTACSLAIHLNEYISIIALCDYAQKPPHCKTGLPSNRALVSGVWRPRALFIQTEIPRRPSFPTLWTPGFGDDWRYDITTKAGSI